MPRKAHNTIGKKTPSKAGKPCAPGRRCSNQGDHVGLGNCTNESGSPSLLCVNGPNKSSGRGCKPRFNTLLESGDPTDAQRAYMKEKLTVDLRPRASLPCKPNRRCSNQGDHVGLGNCTNESGSLSTLCVNGPNQSSGRGCKPRFNTLLESGDPTDAQRAYIKEKLTVDLRARAECILKTKKMYPCSNTKASCGNNVNCEGQLCYKR
jgi:hypothetical protein